MCGATPDGPRAVILSRAADPKAPGLLSGHDYEAMYFFRAGYRGTCSLRVGSTVWPEMTLNAPAAAHLTTILHSTFEGRRSVLVVSISREKKYEQMIRDLVNMGVIEPCLPIPTRAVR